MQNTTSLVNNIPFVLLEMVSSFVTAKEKANMINLISKVFNQTRSSINKLDLSYSPNYSHPYLIAHLRPSIPLRAILSTYKNVIEIDLTKRSLSKVDYEILGTIKSLRTLNLSNIEIVDDHLSELKQLPYLENLAVAGTSITDKGLKYLEEITSLRSLNISYTKITLTGFSSIRIKIPQEKLKIIFQRKSCTFSCFMLQ